jgi:hypothetical protein
MSLVRYPVGTNFRQPSALAYMGYYAAVYGQGRGSRVFSTCVRMSSYNTWGLSYPRRSSFLVNTTIMLVNLMKYLTVLRMCKLLRIFVFFSRMWCHFWSWLTKFIIHLSDKVIAIVTRCDSKFYFSWLIHFWHAEQSFLRLLVDSTASMPCPIKCSAARCAPSLTEHNDSRNNGIHASSVYGHDLMKSMSDLQVWWWVPCSIFSTCHLIT